MCRRGATLAAVHVLLLISFNLTPSPVYVENKLFTGQRNGLKSPSPNHGYQAGNTSDHRWRGQFCCTAKPVADKTRALIPFQIAFESVFGKIFEIIQYRHEHGFE